MDKGLWRVTPVIIIAGAIVLSLNMGLRQTFGLFIEPMSSDIAISRSSFSLAMAVQNILWGILTPFCGILADRFGTGRTLVIGSIVYALGIALMALSESALGTHLGGGLLVGISVGATGFPLVLGAVARLTDEKRRALYISLAATGGSVGQFVLVPLAQILIDSQGWSAALLWLAALALIILLVARPLAGKPQAMAGLSPGRAIKAAIAQAGGHKGFWLLNAGFFVCGFHVAFIAVHLPGYLTSEGMAPIIGATALGVIGFFNILGGVMAGVLGSRFRKKKILTWIYLARAVAIAFLLFAPKTEVTVYAFSAVFGLLWLSTVPLTSALVGDIFGPRYMASLFGLVMMCHQFGGFFGALLGGVSYDLTGSYDAVWIVAILLGLLAALLHWPIPDARMPEPDGATPAPLK